MERNYANVIAAHFQVTPYIFTWGGIIRPGRHGPVGPPRADAPGPAEGVSLNLGISAWSQNRMKGLPGTEGSLTISSAVWIQYTNVTDRPIACRLTRSINAS